MKLTLSQMTAIINSGGSVIFNSVIITKVANLPTQDEIDAFGQSGGEPNLSENTLAVRGRAIHTTNALANNEAEQTDIDLGVSFILERIKTSVPARVRVYASSGHRSADVSRAIGVDPTGAHGVIADIVTTGGNLDLIMSPPIVGVSFTGIPAAKELPVLIENRSGSSASVIVEFTRVVTENPNVENEVVIETSNLGN